MAWVVEGEGWYAFTHVLFSLLGDLGLCNVRVLGMDGDRQSWKMEPETGGGYSSRAASNEIWRPGQSWCCHRLWLICHLETAAVPVVCPQDCVAIPVGCFLLFPTMMLRTVIGRQGLTSSTHATGSAHPPLSIAGPKQWEI